MESTSNDSSVPVPPDAASEQSDGESDDGMRFGVPATPLGPDRRDSADDDDGLDEPTNLLAQMLPDQFRHADPSQYFPEFRKGKVLRFSRLFGPAKPSSKPQIWRGAAKKKAKDQPSTSDDASAESKAATDGLAYKFGPVPSASACVLDEEVLLLKPGSGRGREERASAAAAAEETEAEAEAKRRVEAWRSGPAAYWYDQHGVPRDGAGFDYGLKLRKEGAPAWPPPTTHKPQDFLPVNLETWEDKIVWDGEDIRESLIERLRSGEQPYCGWIPTQYTRTYETFMAALKGGLFKRLLSEHPPTPEEANAMIQEALLKVDFVKEPGPNASIFPPDNTDLIQSNWEDKIIWDAENMSHIPTPRILELDIMDNPRLLGMPEDKAGVGDDLNRSGDGKGREDRKDHQFTRKSQMILGQVERRKREEEEEERVEAAKGSSLDPFNLSNDEFYQAKAAPRQLSSGPGSASLQHSLPAQNIQRPFFPTHLNAFRLRHFYRHPLKRPRGALAKSAAAQPVACLRAHCALKEKEREAQRAALGGGDVFLMRRAADLSARDAHVVLLEYAEEHPPLMSQAGMATKIRNYYKRKAGKESGAPRWEYGETAFTHTSPFLGHLAQGEAIQAAENNLFRAPAFQHNPPHTDFLIIRTRKQYFLREIPAIFTIGQMCPLYEVPSPNSKRASNFLRDFLLAFIYRLFWNSQPPTGEPRSLRMEDIRAAFPNYVESSIRKRLKLCADFRREGSRPDQNLWVVKPDFRLPSREEVEALVTPEMVCAYYSMVIAEQRLKDAGYGEKYFFTPENDDAEETVSMEDEIKCAPWNTTRAYIAAVKGKCFLDTAGAADPTGTGQGFSYVKVSNKPPKAAKEEKETGPKRLVTGTDADLRKLPLKEAKEMLRKFGLREDEISPLSRWEIIDVIRTLSTKQARASSDFSGIGKFARGNIRLNTSELNDKYKADCQVRFEAQNRRLRSDEVVSTDEGSSDDDSDLDEMEAHVHDMLSGKAPHDDEAKEKEELVAMLKSDSNITPSTSASKTSEPQPKAPAARGENKKLKIYRTFKRSDGSEYVRVEDVNRTQLIDAYVKLRQTKDDAFIRAFAQMDADFKEEKRREKRRLQDQQRRLKRSESGVDEAAVASAFVPRPPKPPPPPKPHLAKMKCSACGGSGHMKTNKHCPLYGNSPAKGGGPAPTDDELDHNLELVESAEDLVQVDGTKIRFGKAVIQAAEQMKKQSLKLTFPKSVLESSGSKPSKFSRVSEMISKRDGRRYSSTTGSDFDDMSGFQGPKQTVQRRRADPKILMASIFEKIIAELKDVEGAHYFMEPVNPKLVPDYYQHISSPIDLRTIRDKLTSGVYVTRAAFLGDVQGMLGNSRLYNGDASPITAVAKELVQLAARRLAEKEERLMKLEKAINPLLDDNDVVAFAFCLRNVLDKAKAVPKSFAFHRPVDAKKIKTYYDKISVPMDLGTMEDKLKKHAYTTLDAFRKDLDQIVENSLLFNGPASVFTQKAEEIRRTAVEAIAVEAESLASLEHNIQKALEAAETESLMTGASSIAGDSAAGEEPMEEEGAGAAEGGEEGGEERAEGDESWDPAPDDGAEEDDGGEEAYDPVMDLMGSIERGGQLHADLAMSDSDSDESVAKKSRLEENLLDDL